MSMGHRHGSQDVLDGKTFEANWPWLWDLWGSNFHSGWLATSGNVSIDCQDQ